MEQYYSMYANKHLILNTSIFEVQNKISENCKSIVNIPVVSYLVENLFPN